MKISPLSPVQEKELMTELWSPGIADDPYNFVMFAFPWGVRGTPLENETGPRTWQAEKLRSIARHIKMNNIRALNGELYEIMQDATVSGRGIGKSALVAWLVLWFMSTKLGGTVIVTANTEQQLKSRTWAELGTWHTLLINSHWFECQALSLRPEQWFEELLKNDLKIDTGYYYAAAQLWSEENPDAFAGVHNQKGVMLVFDEGSGIPPAIWSVSKGFFTEKKSLHRYWFVFSNGRRNTGTFFECFHKNRAFWSRAQIDARTVEGTDPNIYSQIIAEHGADSDEARVEVYGQFPSQGESQFISRDVVSDAMEREIELDSGAALIMGVDPARFGDDDTVIWFRRGRDARSIPPITMRGKDNMYVANRCAELIDQYRPSAVCVDAGSGTGIIDRLREMKYKVSEIWFGSVSEREEFGNKRTQLWADMRDWLRGGCIPLDDELKDDLVSPNYKFLGRSDKIVLESKEEMKKRGFSSPDRADALACTFGVRVARLDSTGRRRTVVVAKDSDYSIFGD